MDFLYFIVNEPEERLIDGPANIREKPSAKSPIVASLPNHKKVTVLKREMTPDNEWFFIRWKENGKEKSGWTYIGNLICD